MKGNIDVYRDEYEIFCIVYDDCTPDDILLFEEEIRSAALEEVESDEEKEIVLESQFEIIPRDEGGFYVEFSGFVE